MIPFVSSATTSSFLSGSASPPASFVVNDVDQGHVVAGDGPTAVVGSPLAKNRAGSVKIHDSATGGSILELIDPNPVEGGQFGAAVAISGTSVLVGAPGDGRLGGSGGSVYLYDLSSATPDIAVLSLNSPDVGDERRFGHAVAIEGTRIVVGDYHSDAGVGGRAYLFDLSLPVPELPLVEFLNPDATPCDGFGRAVSLSGERVAIGAYRKSSGDYAAGAVLIYDLSSPSPPIPAMSIPSPDPTNHGLFGFAVDLDGNRLAVGAVQEGAEEVHSGRVYTFQLPIEGEPVIEFVLTPTLDPDHWGFGHSIALAGDRLLVGIPHGDAAQAATGSACWFDLGGTTPTIPIIVLQDPEGDACIGFGTSVSIADGRVIAGAPFSGPGMEHLGKAYIFDPASESPDEPAAAMNESFPTRETHFGSSLAVDGSLVVVGAPYDNSAGLNSGAVFVYDWSGDSLEAPLMILTAPNPAPNDHFGSAVAVSGTTVVVGAPQDDGGGFNTGRVYVFSVEGGVAVLVAELDNPSPDENDVFGGSVAISGSRVVVGAHRDDNVEENAGAAYLFDLLSPSPTAPVSILINPDADIGDYFGAAVAISGDRIAVGAPHATTDDDNAGRIFFYHVTPSGTLTLTATIDHPEPDSGDHFGGSIALSNKYLVTGSVGDDIDDDDNDPDTGSKTGSAFVFDVSGPEPVLLVSLASPGNLDNAGYGASVAVEGDRVVIGALGSLSDSSSEGGALIYDMTSPLRGTPVMTLLNPANSEETLFGATVGISGDRVFVGSPSSNQAGFAQGALHVFEPFFADIQIVVSGSPLPSGSVVDTGGTVLGGSRSIPMLIHNPGSSTLSVLSLDWFGDGIEFFTPDVTTGSLVPPLGSIPITVVFTPADMAEVQVGVTVTSDDPEEPTVSVTFTGHGTTADELFELWVTAAGLEDDDAQAGATPYGEGVENLLKYAFNMNGSGPDLQILTPDTGVAGLPSVTLEGSAAERVLRLEFVRRKGSGLHYIPKASTSLAPDTYVSIEGVESVTDIDAHWERVIVTEPADPATRPTLFGIVEVSIP